MSGFFCNSPRLQLLERQMRQPPGYRPRGQGWMFDILFHAARDVYLGTKHIRLSELTDRELIPDEILRLIVNAFVMERYGVDIVEREVWNED